MSAPTTTSGRERVLVLTGPTAGGKSALAVETALRFGGEVINADSMQVYRFLDIGTAKPSFAERARVPHHLFDIVTPDVIYSAGRFAREARACAAQVHARGKLAILVGGTGLYIRAFLKGMIEAGGVDAALRERLEQEHERAVKEGDPLRLHRRLQAQDPDAALRIHPNDLRRIVRALEIRSLSGEPASRLQLDHAFGDRPYDTLHVALDPGVEEIDARIDRRCQQMIDAGLLREVRSLHDRGYGPGLRSMRGIGYRHVNPVAEGSDTLANALVAMQRDTRRFARRQRTWLRKVDEAIWIDPRRPNDLMRAVEQFVSAPSGDSEESLGGGTAGRISRPAPGS